MKRITVLFVLATSLLAGCAVPHKEEVTEATEVPTPDTVSDSVLSLSKEEITVSYGVTGTQAFGLPNKDYLTVYESPESFNSCTVEIEYMPNYERMSSIIPDGVYISQLDNGYVTVVTDGGIGEAGCNAIATTAEITGYTPVD